MSPLAYVDETYSPKSNTQATAFYQLTAIVVDQSDVASCRTGAVKVAPAGFHAAPMAARGDGATVTAMLEYAASNTGWGFITMTTSAADALEPLRQRCLEDLLLTLNQQKVGLVIADSRLAKKGYGHPQVNNRKDLATYQRLRTTGQLDTSIKLKHQNNTHEPLLCLPDAVGWAHRRHHLTGDYTYWPIVASVTSVNAITL